MYTVTHHDVLLNTTPDPTLKDFFKQKERFADLINCLLFHGHTVLCDENLSLYDSNSSTVFDHKAIEMSVNKGRDIMMRVNHNDLALLIPVRFRGSVPPTAEACRSRTPSRFPEPAGVFHPPPTPPPVPPACGPGFR